MSQELQRKQETPQGALQRLLTTHRGAIEAVVPKTMRPDRLIRLAVTALHNNTTLQSCSMISIANSVMLSAQLGLEVNNGLGHAYLVPYSGVCTFQPGYRGLIDLAYRSGTVKDIQAHLVYDNDEFDYQLGDDPRLKHKPCVKGERGDWYGGYSVVKMNDGEVSFYYMSRAEIDAVRDKCSQSWSGNYRKKSPWFTWPEEMAKKTIVKRHLKMRKLSVDTDLAVGLDDQAEGFAAIPKDETVKAKEIAQDVVIEAEFLNDAEVATDELKGSSEKQEELRLLMAEEAKVKLDQLKGGKKPAKSDEKGDDW